MFKIAQRILFLLNQNLYFFRETEPVGCVYKKGDLFEGIGSAVLEAGKSKVKVSAGLVSPAASFFGLQMATFSRCPHLIFSLCA